MSAIEDPVFGSLIFERGVWTSPPATQPPRVPVMIVAPSSGPTDTQRTFFLDLQATLPALQTEAAALVSQFVTSDLARLSLYAVEIGSDDACRAGNFTLELSDSDAHAIHRVSFKAHQPVAYECDF